MGWDSIEPFVTGKYSNKGAFILCKTSNPGSNDLLALNLQRQSTLFEKIANLSNEWSSKAETNSPSENKDPPRLGLVVGATDPQALEMARKAAGPSIWILAPGVGAQGGDLDAACQAGLNDDGTGMLIPVSRGISRAADPAEEARKLKVGINEARQKVINKRKSDQTDVGTIAHYQKEFIEFSLKEDVLRFGSFVLKSGRTSPYFFNAGLFSNGSALFKLGKAYAASIMASDQLVNKDGNVIFDIVFGPAYKGISLGALVCAALYSDFGVESGFTYNRKEAKDHGEGGILVGASIANKRVLIVDDVITAGTAIRESFDLLKKYEAPPVGVSIALDRAEKRSLEDPLSAVQAVARDLEIPVVSIVALPQLQEFLQSSPDYDNEVLKQVSDYRCQYGI
jgi:orotate phosphoribosyltransferase